MNDTLIFPRIVRRKSYRRTKKGTFYKDYTKYRQEIREDCQGRCVYCDCHENELGGKESMNLDHLRPKGNSNFAHLINNPNNLVWSCSRCNNLKGDHWPAMDPNVTFDGDIGFLDPFGVNRLHYFRIISDGALQPLQPPASYMIEILGLNSHTPRKRREQRIIAANQIAMIDKLLETNRGGITDEAVRVLEQNRAYLEKQLDFCLY